MIRFLAGVLLPTLLFLPGAPAFAQEWQVAREQFAFAGSRLDIRVEVESEGTLRILRGEAGNVRVAGRAISGFTAAGLTADEQLTLSALADGPVHYMVSVPEGVWITVRLPDRHRSESVASHGPGRTFQWGTTRLQASADAPSAQHDAPSVESFPLWVSPDPADPFEATLFTTFTGATPPAEVALPELRWIRSVTVRLEGTQFRVATSRPLAVARGDPRRLEIRPAGPPMDVVVILPEGTTDFSLLTAGATALRLHGTDLLTLCAPVTRQWLSDGRRWVTFTPVDGALQCGPPATLRHEG